MSVKWYFKRKIIFNYHTRILFTLICLSVQICKSFQNLQIFKPLSSREDRNLILRSFVIVFFYVFCLILVKLWKDALHLTLRKRIQILSKLRTTLFNYRPKIFRQLSSNKMQLNMNSPNRIYTDSPRDLATT